MATEVTYLAKKIYDLEEEFEKIKEDNRQFSIVQDVCMEKLQKYFNKKANEEMKNEYNYLFKQKEKNMRITGQTFFESQLQTSMRNESNEEILEEEDKEARDMDSIQDQKLL